MVPSPGPHKENDATLPHCDGNSLHGPAVWPLSVCLKELTDREPPTVQVHPLSSIHTADLTYENHHPSVCLSSILTQNCTSTALHVPLPCFFSSIHPRVSAQTCGPVDQLCSSDSSSFPSGFNWNLNKFSLCLFTLHPLPPVTFLKVFALLILYSHFCNLLHQWIDR